MRTIQEIEKRLECEAGFASIATLEAQMPDDGGKDEVETFESWAIANGLEAYLPDSKYE